MKTQRIQFELDAEAAAKQEIKALVREVVTGARLLSLARAAVIDELNLLTARQAARLLKLGHTKFHSLRLPCVNFGARGARYKATDIAAEIERRKS